MTRAAVVGLGGIAGEHFAKLAELPAVEVVGVCDLSPTLVDAVCDRFDVGPGFTDYARMLAETRPDAVHVVTPPASHRDLVLAALDAGAHVLVEKPIAPSYEGYVEMRDAAAAAGRMLVENYNYRFTGAFLEALELVRAGALGKVVNLDVTFTVGLADPGGPYADAVVPHFAHDLPGGAIRNFASHPASLLVALLGRHDWQRGSTRRLAPWAASDDELRALIGFGDATAALTITSHAQPPVFELAVHGTGGAVEVDLLGRRSRAYGSPGGGARLTDPLRHAAGDVAATAALLGRTLTASQDLFEGFRRLVRAFYAAVEGRAEPPLPEVEMDAANRLVEDLLSGDAA